MALKIGVKKLPGTEDLALPSYQTNHSAGMDIVSAQSVEIAPGERTMISTGLTVAIPDGFEAQIRPRSGLAVKHGITLVNTPGTIDADYRGEIRIIMINHGDEVFAVKRGERIAQMIIAPVTRCNWELMDELPESGRGEGGFGSTGR